MLALETALFGAVQLPGQAGEPISWHFPAQKVGALTPPAERVRNHHSATKGDNETHTPASAELRYSFSTELESSSLSVTILMHTLHA